MKSVIRFFDVSEDPKISASAKEITALITVFTLAATIPVLRFELVPHYRFGSTLWAEDGMFIYSAYRNNFSIIFEPYRGYWQAIPRILAFMISNFPILTWAYVTAMTWLCINAFVALLHYKCFRNLTNSVFGSAVASLVPTFAPIMGAEAIGCLANLNVLFGLSAIVVGLSFPTFAVQGKGRIILLTGYLSLIVLTTPISGPILILIFFFHYRQTNERKIFYFASVLIFLSFLAQLVISYRFGDGRSFVVSLDLIQTYLNQGFDVLLSQIPGLSWQSTNQWGQKLKIVPGFKQLIFISFIVVSSVQIVKSRFLITKKIHQIFFVSGFCLWIMAMLRGDGYQNSSRYFIYLILPFLTGIVFLVRKSVKSNFYFSVLVCLLLVIWTPGLQVSNFRTSGASWSSYVRLANMICESSQSKIVEVQFAPNWPIDWGFELSGRNSNRWPCPK